jgi:7-cyano-7-deazaguanine synthase
MSRQRPKTQTALLLSGGIDSAVLLKELLNDGRQVVPIYVRTGCTWEACERRSIEQLLAALACPEIADLVVLEMPLADLYGDHWSISGSNVPSDSTDDDAVYLPGRNPLMLIKPALWCRMHGTRHIALATLAANPFPDATPTFFRQFETMLREAVGGELQILRPFEKLSKAQVLELGRDLPLDLTFSCLAPVDGRHCGRCNKCGERKQGFRDVGIVDRTLYAAVDSAAAGAQRPSSLASLKCT